MELTGTDEKEEAIRGEGGKVPVESSDKIYVKTQTGNVSVSDIEVLN